MNWSEFIIELLEHDLRISSLEAANLTGIQQPIIDRWKRGDVQKPQRSTIKRLEEGLKIRINDRDIHNITYKRNEPDIQVVPIISKYNEFPIISKVYAGDAPEMFTDENILDTIVLPYPKKDNVFAVRVVGDSMNHVIAEGDLILVDMDKEIMNGKIVIARLRSGKQIIKRYKLVSPFEVMFYSDNGNYDPIFVNTNDIEAIYRVVYILKEA